MKMHPDFGLYAILTNPLKGYEYLTEVLVNHQVPFIQLRMKDEPADQVLAMAEKIRKLTSGTSSKFIVNDSPQIAKEVGADGVHIGQDDMQYEDARAIVGPEMNIGMSTHSPAQTRDACACGPDYIGIGPVFATPTKTNPDPVIGIDGMRKMLSIATVPAVAIGGIDLTNLRNVLTAGARNFCMVRQITQAEDPESVLNRIASLCKEMHIRWPVSAISSAG